MTAPELVDLLEQWVDAYPVISIEDGMAEDDWQGWRLLTERLGQRVALIGDDLFTTNPVRLREGIARRVANAVLVKVNQIGTLSETLETIALARDAGYCRSSRPARARRKTPRSPILPWAHAPGRSRSARLRRSERLAKYNQLLRIEEELGPGARYRGAAVFAGFRRG